MEQATSFHQLKKKPLLFRLRKEMWTFFELKILAKSHNLLIGLAKHNIQTV